MSQPDPRALADWFIEQLRKPRDPDAEAETEAFEARKAALLHIWHIRRGRKPATARTRAEMEFAASLEPCPRCGQLGIGSTGLTGAGTSWTLTATCPSCGTARSFTYATQGDPAQAPPHGADELSHLPSFLIRAESFHAELQRLLPLASGDLAAHQRALICANELTKLAEPRSEVRAAQHREARAAQKGAGKSGREATRAGGAVRAAQAPEVERIWSEIKARPRDFEPRRRLAKVLSEKGDPFGELLTLAFMTDEEIGARNREDERAGHGYKFLEYREARVEALLQEHGRTWFPKHPAERLRVDLNTIRKRGLPDHLALFSFTQDPLEVLMWFTARYPLRALTIDTKDPAPVIDAVEAGGHFARLEDLSFEGNHWSPAAMEALRHASPGPLKAVLSAPADATIDGTAILGARVFAETTSLRISRTSLEETALETLWANCPKLEALHLHQVKLKALPRLGYKPLRLLDIAGPWTADQAIALMSGLELRSVQKLELKEGAGSKNAIRWIADQAMAGRFESLEELVLQDSYVDDGHVEALARAVPKSLRLLDLDGNSFGAKGVAALAGLANSGRCPRLEAIRMRGVFVGSGRYTEGDDGGAYWQASPGYEIKLSIDEIRQKFGFPAGLSLQ